MLFTKKKKKDIYTVLMVNILYCWWVYSKLLECMMFRLSIIYVKQEAVCGERKLGGFI